MRVKMLVTRRGSHDGFDIRQYHKGEIYDLPDNLARYFIRWNSAVSLEPNKTMEEVTQELIAKLRRLRTATNPATYEAKGEPL